MGGLQSIDVASLSLAERGGLVSSMLTHTYSSHWSARVIGRQHAPISVGGCSTDGIAVARARLLPLALLQQPRHARHETKYYVYTADQTQVISIEGREPLRLNPNEPFVMSTNMPAQIIVPRSYTTTALIFDSDLFHQYFRDPQRVLGQRLEFPCGLEAAMTAIIESAWTSSNTGMLGHVAPALMRSFLEILSLAGIPSPPAQLRNPGTALDIRRQQVKSYIEQHYASTETSIALIAKRLHLSERYLQLAFEGDDSTPSAYLRNCRLRASARLLRDPDWARRSITEICYTCGYNSSAHFSSEFKRAYGISPREYRRSDDIELP